MSDRPVHGAVGTSAGSGQDLADPPQDARAGGPGVPPRISDFGQFDWFADSVYFDDTPAGGSRHERRRSWRRPRSWRPRAWLESRRKRGSIPGGTRTSWRRGWRLLAAVTAVAVVCTLIGGVIGGIVAARSMGNEADPTYTLGTSPRGLASRPASSVAGIAARDTRAVVMIKVNNGQGTGSGFVIKGGYIITDNHVVTLDGLLQHAPLKVYFSDGRAATAHVVGRDPYSDIAVIKVPGMTGLPALTLGNSTSVAVGDPVVAIGSPLGLSDTVTSGIVSALNRPVQPGSATGSTPQVFFDAIQTDAPINPGNSGGPLVNAKGQVIGVDAAIDTLGDDPITGTQGGSIGLGFAIPVNQARRVIVQLIRTGHATHSVLGATLNESYTGDGAQIAASSRGSGRAVVPGGPAARAGLHAGDVVTKLGKLPITSSYALLDAVQSQAPGTTDAVTFLQHGQLQHGRLTLGSASS